MTELHWAGEAGRRTGERRCDGRRALFYALTGRGRRRCPRRREDRLHGSGYRDRFSLADGLWLLATVILCVADALLTLLILAHGGRELNPFMERLLQADVSGFFWTKFLLTSSALLLVLLHRDFVAFGRLRGIHLIYAAGSGYALLVAYELTLLARLFNG